MAIDLSESGQGYYDLKSHIGHKIVVVGYGDPEYPPVNIAVECETCNCVLIDFDEPEPPEVEPEEKEEREIDDYFTIGGDYEDNEFRRGLFW